MSRLVSLYPRTWRERYGDELLWLMTQRPPSFTDRIDIVRGAIDARLHPQLPAPARTSDRSGFAPLIGLGLLAVAMWSWANGPIRYDEYGAYRDGSAGAAPFLAAMSLLMFGLYRLVRQLPSTADVTRTFGLVGILAGMLWSIMPWAAGAAVPFLVGVLGFAVGARRAGVVSTWFAVGITVVLVVPIGLFGAMAVLPWYVLRQLGLHAVVILAPLAGLYVVVALGLLRGPTGPASRGDVGLER